MTPLNNYTPPPTVTEEEAQLQTIQRGCMAKMEGLMHPHIAPPLQPHSLRLDSPSTLLMHPPTLPMPIVRG